MTKKKPSPPKNLPVPRQPLIAISDTVIRPARVFKVPARQPKLDGPWRQEYEKIAWVDEATGLDCIMLRQPDGTLSGYVGVKHRHPLFGYSHDAVLDTLGLNVHGGLTYSRLCDTGTPEPCSVCHLSPKRPPDPQPIEDEVWWFGFDTNHESDLVPSNLHRGLREDGKTYRDHHYVYGECIKLAEGLRELEKEAGVPLPERQPTPSLKGFLE